MYEKVYPDISVNQLSPLDWVRYHKFQLSRTYPKATRVWSDNYDPMPIWLSGCQIVALNYQTSDRPMQVNQGWFLQNGGCGYVLKPKCMREAYFDPYDTGCLGGVSCWTLTVTAISGRLLSASGRGVCSKPFLCLEIIGLPMDNKRVRTCELEVNNGLTPEWEDEQFSFTINCPDVTLLRLELCDEVDQKVLLGQATYPVIALRQGYRQVPLQNGFSEDMALSTLLMHIAIEKA